MARGPAPIATLIALVASIASRPAGAQRVAEVEAPTLPREAAALLASVRRAPDGTAAEALAAIRDALPTVRDPRSRFDLILRGLAPLNAAAGEHGASFEALRTGQASGLFFPLQIGERTFPQYLAQLRRLEGFDAFLAENERLRGECQAQARMEYFVRLPELRTPGRTYPLVMAFHGGFGSHAQLALDWDSPRLRSDHIVAFVQGAVCRGSFLRAYGPSGAEDAVQAFRQLSSRYPVDTTKVVLAGQSAGAVLAMTLALDELIPAAGLLLAFPAVRRDSPEETALRRAAQRRLRMAVLNGESDPGIALQKAFGVRLDEAGIANRFLILSGTGHEFPPRFSEEIDLSLAYVLDRR